MPDKDNMIKKIADLVGQQTNQDRKNLVSSVGKEIAQTLLPVLSKIFEKSRIDREEITDAIREGFDGLNIEVPEASVDVHIPEIKVPEPRVTVNIPAIKIPEIKLPENKEMTGWLNLVGWDKSFLQSPLPVQLRDANGKPVSFPQNVTQMLGGGSGGGKMDYFTIKGFAQSAFAEISNPDGRVKVELPTGGSSLTDTELRAAHLDVQQVSGSIDSVNVLQLAGDALAKGTELNAGFLRTILAQDVAYSVNVVSGSTSGTEYLDSAVDTTPTGTVAMGFTGDDGADIFALRTHSGIVNSGVLRVVHATDVGVSVSATDLDIRDLVNATDSVSAYQVSGANWSVNVTNADLDIRDLVNATDSISAYQVSGANWSVNVTNVDLDVRDLVNATDSVSAYQVSGSIWSTNVTNTVTVTGSLTSAVVVGPTPADTADDGSAPVQIGGIARTANPTAVAANDVVKSTHDDLGRQIMRPLQVRDLTKTAYVSVTSGTETTLLAGVAGAYLDCIMLVGSNNSDAAVSVDVRAVTAGSIIHTLRIPANGTAGWAPVVPWPQDETGNNWTVDGPDETGRTLTFSALFSQEI